MLWDLIFSNSGGYLLAIEPFTALAIFSAGAQAIFGINAGKQRERAMREQARVAEENAKIQANRILYEDMPRMMGDQTVAYAKAGVLPTGSAFANMMDTARRMTRDASNVRRGAALEAQYLRQQGRVERRNANMQALFGAGNAALNIAQMEKTAAFTRGTTGTTMPNVDSQFYMPGGQYGQYS